MGAESKLQRQCIDHLKSLGIYHLNIYGSGRTGKGAPDLIACIGGRFVAFELKTPSGKMSDAQRIHKTRIERSGGEHHVPRTFEQFKMIVREEVKAGG